MDQGHQTDLVYLTNPWHNGVSISELLANTLTDIREFVKEVEHFDSEGRLILPPKLLLIGTEHHVRTKAHALNNLKICLAFLDSLPNFPHIPYNPEHILTRPNALKYVLKCIENYFNFEQPFFVPNGLPKQLQLNNPSHYIAQNRKRSTSPSSNSVYSGRPYAEPWKNSKVTFYPASASQNNEKESTRPASTSRSTRGSSQSSSKSPSRPSSVGRKSQNQYSSRFDSHPNSSTGERSSPAARAIARKNIPPEKNPYEYKDWKQWINNVKSNPSMISETKPTTAPKKKKEMDSAQMNLLIKKNEMLKERLKVQKKDRLNRSNGTNQHLYDEMILKKNLKMRLKDIDKSLLQDQFGSRRNDDNSEISSESGSQISGRSSRRGSSKNSLIINSYLTNSNSNLWLPPQSTKLEVDFAQSKVYPNLSNKQLKIIKAWLYKLGINIREGEGGFYSIGSNNHFSEIYEDHSNNFYTNTKISHSNASSGPTLVHSNSIKSLNPLPLSHDRLRNGEYFFKLFNILEPQAALQANIMKQLIPSPSTIYEAEINLIKILWVWKVIRSPPLPLEYFILYREVVNGNKNYIWGFLYEVMQYYSSVKVNEEEEEEEEEREKVKEKSKTKVTSSKDQETPKDSPNTIDDNQKRNKSSIPPPPAPTPIAFAAHPPPIPSSAAELNSPKLPYTLEQRNNLDISLLSWFQQLGLVKHFLGSISDQINTILYFESYIKDGTLLCFICHHIFHLPIHSYLKNPLSYKQCLLNVSKVVKQLRVCPSMSKRFLYKNIEEDIIRGNWDCILGLLEDLHVFYDRLDIYYDNKTSTYKRAAPTKPKTKESAGSLSYIQTLPSFDDVKMNPNCFYLPNESIIFPYLGKQCLQSYASMPSILSNDENIPDSKTKNVEKEKKNSPYYDSVFKTNPYPQPASKSSLQSKERKSTKKVSFNPSPKINKFSSTSASPQSVSSFIPDSPDSLNGSPLNLDKNLHSKNLLPETITPKEKNVTLSADSFLSYILPNNSDSEPHNQPNIPFEDHTEDHAEDQNFNFFGMIGAASNH